MGTHRRNRQHAQRRALVVTAAAGGLFITGVPIVESTVTTERSATGAPLAQAPAAVRTASVAHHMLIAEAEHEVRRRIDQRLRFEREALEEREQPRASRGRHARPQPAATTPAPEQNSKATAIAKATAKAKAAAKAKEKAEAAAKAKLAAAKAKEKAEAVAKAKAAAKATAARKRTAAAPKPTRASALPIKGSFRITSTFAAHAGRMKGGVGGGTDYAVATGTRVYATHPGRVVAAGRSGGGYGIWVAVDYRGYQTIYAHLSRTDVRRGDNVRAGDLLGRSGSTGNSTGPHLHYELRRNGVSVDPRKVDLRRL